MNETRLGGDMPPPAAAERPFALELRHIAKTYHTSKAKSQTSPSLGGVTVLKDASLTLSAGEIVGLVAPSGSGKSTLLHIAGLLDQADHGEVLLGGTLVSGLDDHRRTALRREEIGFVYQFHHLLPEFSALENIMLPQMAAGVPDAQARSRAADLLFRTGLAERQHHRPAAMSGGEQQRVALCRALANQPHVLLADEPTGNLDPGTSEQIFTLLLELVKGTGLTALIATHNLALARRMDRVLCLEQGEIRPFEWP